MYDVILLWRLRFFYTIKIQTYREKGMPAAAYGDS